MPGYVLLLAWAILGDPVISLMAKLAKNSTGTSSIAHGLAIYQNPIHEEDLIVHMISIATTSS